MGIKTKKMGMVFKEEKTAKDIKKRINDTLAILELAGYVVVDFYLTAKPRVAKSKKIKKAEISQPRSGREEQVA